MVIKADYGKLQSPGFINDPMYYPPNIECSFTIMRPDDATTPMSLMMNKFNLDTTDFLQVIKFI